MIIPGFLYVQSKGGAGDIMVIAPRTYFLTLYESIFFSAMMRPLKMGKC